MKYFALTVGPLPLAILIGLSGCAHRPTTPLTPGQQVSLTLNQSLSVVATLNKSVASDVIALNAQGLISRPLTNSILSWQKALAQQVLAVEAIQRSGDSAEQKALAIKNAFASLHLPPEVAALLAQPQTGQAVIALVTTIESIVSLAHSLAGA